MAQYTAYANYVIFFSDPSEYAFAVGTTGGNFILTSPRSAAQLFGIPFPYPSGDMSTIPKGIYFNNPYIPGFNITHPNPSGVILDDNIDSFLVPGQAGNPASIWPPGPDLLLKWSGTIIKTNGQAGTSTGLPPNSGAIPQRRWICAFEMSNRQEGGQNSEPSNMFNRSCSRTIDGRGGFLESNTPWRHNLNEYRPGFQSKTSWERFYFRLNRAGANDNVFWATRGNTSPSQGGALRITTGGSLEAGYNNNSNFVPFATVLNPQIGVWYLVDMFLRTDTGVSNPGRMRIFINHLEVGNFSQTNGQGLNANQFHISSGMENSGLDAQFDINLDDWINADLPDNIDSTTLVAINNDFPIDFLMGSHIKLHYSDSAVITGWTPNNRGILNQAISPQSNQNSVFTSTTSGASIDGLTDVLSPDIQDYAAGASLGPVSALIGAELINGGALDGQLGYRVIGGASVMTTVAEAGTVQGFSVLYSPTGLTVPQPINPFHVVRTKSLDAVSSQTDSLQAIVEYIGVWGPEDDPSFQLLVNRDFRHNCRYTNTIWGYLGPVSDAPVYIIGGTYIGNGLYQEILLPAPAHMIIIHPTTGANRDPYIGFAAGHNINDGIGVRVIPNFRMWTDSTGQAKFAVWGSGAQVNTNGTTYQYIVYCDPGMRFNVTGCYRVADVFNSFVPHTLTDPNFIPVMGLVQLELINSSQNANGMWAKFPQNLLSQGVLFNGGLITNFGTFAQGLFTNGTDLNLPASQMNYSMWRTSEPGCEGVMVQLGHYIGDATVSRAIPLTPTSGRFPLMVIVVSGQTASYIKTPGMGATESIIMNSSGLGTVSTTAIISVAIDSITIGVTVNVLNQPYYVFVLPGSATSFQNGIFFNPNCEPPTGGRGVPLVPEPGINLLPEGGLVLDGTDPLTLLKDVSGIYTLIPNKHNDTLIDRQTGQTSIDVEIPDPSFGTGFIGG